MLHYFPLEHIPNRYTTHLDRDVLEYLESNNIPHIYYEPKTPSGVKSVSDGNFLNAVDTVYRQSYQMTQFLENWSKGKVNDGDIVFISDLWNFAVAGFNYLKYFTGKKIEVRGLFHAGAFTDADIVHNLERTYHGFEETLFDCCDRIFLATNDFKSDLLSKRFVDERKISVVPLPLDFKNLSRVKNKGIKKENIVLFNGRHSVEKHPEMFEMLKQFRPNLKYIDCVGEKLSRTKYFEAMAKSRVVVSFADEETFGYGIQEAVYLGCVPVVPDRLCYREQFSKEYRYSDFLDAVDKVDAAISGKLLPTVPFVTENETTFRAWFSSQGTNLL